MSKNQATGEDPERAVICLVLHGGAFADVMGIGVRAEDFQDLNRKLIWQTILHVFDKSGAVASGDVIAHLPLKAPRVSAEFSACLGGGPFGLNARYYAQELVRRRWVRTGVQELTAARDKLLEAKPFQDDGEIRKSVARAIAAVECNIGAKRSFVTAADAARQLELEIEERIIAARTGQKIGMPTQVPLLDDEIGGGLRKGRYYILGARPAMGKTTLALNITSKACMSGKRGAYFTMEMSAAEIGEVCACIIGGVDKSDVQIGHVSEKQVAALGIGLDALRQMPLTFVDDFGRTIEGLISRSKMIHRTQGLDFIVVDYFQLLVSDQIRSQDKRSTELGKASMALKALSMDLGVPILCLSQINREAESRTGEDPGLPGLHHLKDTGSLEQDADAVMILHRGAFYTSQGTDTYGRAQLKLAKNRWGRTGILEVPYDLSCGRFGDWPPRGG